MPRESPTRSAKPRRFRCSRWVLVPRHAPGRRQPLNIEAFLHGHRQAEKRLIGSGRAPFVRGLGRVTRSIEIPDHNGVDVSSAFWIWSIAASTSSSELVLPEFKSAICSVAERNDIEELHFQLTHQCNAENWLKFRVAEAWRQVGCRSSGRSDGQSLRHVRAPARTNVEGDLRRD